MNKYQTFGQIMGLTPAGFLYGCDFENTFIESSSCSEAHTPPRSSSVADPSHSPIERGQRHGPRGSVWKRCGCVVWVSSSRCSGGWLGNGFGYGYGKFGINNVLRKDFDLCFVYLKDSEILTWFLKFSQRSLDG